MSNNPDGGYMGLLERLLSDLRQDVVALREQNGDIERVARDAFNKINEIERRLQNLENASHKDERGWTLTPAWFTAIISAIALLATGLFHVGKALAGLLVETLKVLP